MVSLPEEVLIIPLPLTVEGSDGGQTRSICFKLRGNFLTVADNASLQNHAVSSGNISERMKIQTSTQMSVNSEDF